MIDCAHTHHAGFVDGVWNPNPTKWNDLPCEISDHAPRHFACMKDDTLVPCPGPDGDDGWMEFRGKCVKIFEGESPAPNNLTGENWYDARDLCASIGAYLPRIDNAEMNEWVRKLNQYH